VTMWKVATGARCYSRGCLRSNVRTFPDSPQSDATGVGSVTRQESLLNGPKKQDARESGDLADAGPPSQRPGLSGGSISQP